MLGSRLAVLMAVLITLTPIPASVAAQTATLFALPVTPDPAECGIAPRATEDIAAFLIDATPVAGGLAGAFSLVGVPADHATTAFALSIVREAIACGNAHGFPGVAALLSDEALARHVLSQGMPAEALTFADISEPPQVSERRALIDVRDVVLRDDGRVGAVVLIEDPARGKVERRYTLVLAEGVAGAEGSDQYLFLIDAVAVADEVPIPAPAAGTPEP